MPAHARSHPCHPHRPGRARWLRPICPACCRCSAPAMARGSRKAMRCSCAAWRARRSARWPWSGTATWAPTSRPTARCGARSRRCTATSRPPRPPTRCTCTTWPWRPRWRDRAWRRCCWPRPGPRHAAKGCATARWSRCRARRATGHGTATPPHRCRTLRSAHGWPPTARARCTWCGHCRGVKPGAGHITQAPPPRSCPACATIQSRKRRSSGSMSAGAA